MPRIDENTENPPIFTRKTPKIHVKRDKNGRKYTFFSDGQNIENTFADC